MSKNGDKPIKKSTRGYKVNKQDAYYMACQGASITEIAKKYEVTPSAICQLLKHLKPRIESYIAFTNHKDTALENIQYQVLEQVNAKTIANMGAAQAITGAAILEDKIRLIRGQSTANTVNLNLSADLQERIKSLESLKDKLVILPGVSDT